MSTRVFEGADEPRLLLALVSAVLGAGSSLAAYGAPEAISREEFRRKRLPGGNCRAVPGRARG
jgi:hypothetical protein